VIPVGLAERSFVAKLPSVATTVGSISSTCRKRCDSQASALEDVRDVDLGALKTDAGEELVEQLSRLADERVALLVLVEARRLADEHQVGVRVAGAEHDLRSPLREAAARASRDLFGERCERGCVGHRRECRPVGGRTPRSVRKGPDPSQSTRTVRGQTLHKSTRKPRGARPLTNRRGP
jgi:hypothetical protein